VKSPAAWWGATIGALLVYTSAVLVSFPPPLWFLPRLGTWGFLAVPGEPAIRWFGWLLDAAAGGLLGMVAGRLVARRPPGALVWLLATASLLLLAWHERHWFQT
jgi:hypothetical protein